MTVHKAEPRFATGDGVTHARCLHCDEEIHVVPGGHGPTWVHDATGAVAGPNSDDALDEYVDEDIFRGDR